MQRQFLPPIRYFSLVIALVYTGTFSIIFDHGAAAVMVKATTKS
jgi:hypothetical protein